jgi:hypothetical protein
LWLALLRSPASWRGAALGGVCLGLACLARGATLILVPLLCLWLLRTRGTRAALALAAGCVLMVAPWTLRNERVLGAPVPVDTNGAVNFYWGWHPRTPLLRPWDLVNAPDKPWPATPPGAGEVAMERAALRDADAFVAAHPLRAVLGLLVRAGNLWGLERGLPSGLRAGLYGPPRGLLIVAAALWCAADGLLLLCLGALGLAALRRRDAAQLALLMIVTLTLAHAASYGHSRYRFGALPLLFVAAASALADRGAWHQAPESRRRAACLIAGLLTVNMVYEVVVLEIGHQLGWL